MTLTQSILTIAICSVATMLTRFLPFIVFSGKRPTPKIITYLGRALPGALFGMLIVYCLKDTSFTVSPFGVPELIGIALTALLQIWKKQPLISIAGGTIVYMLLIRIL